MAFKPDTSAREAAERAKQQQMQQQQSAISDAEKKRIKALKLRAAGAPSVTGNNTTQTLG